MDQNITALERAFQLAKSGQVTGMSGIRAILKQEGYAGTQLEGPRLMAQLRKLIVEAGRRDAPDPKSESDPAP